MSYFALLPITLLRTLDLFNAQYDIMNPAVETKRLGRCGDEDDCPRRILQCLDIPCRSQQQANNFKAKEDGSNCKR